MTQMQLTSFQSIPVFLQHFYREKKKNDPQFSYAVWAQELGIKSRTQLHSLIMGERPVNEKMAAKFIAYFHFSEMDADYFLALCHYSQSRNPYQKKIFLRKLMAAQGAQIEFAEIENIYDFLSQPLLPRLQTLLSFDDIKTDPSSLAETLGITEQEAEEGLQALSSLDLINYDKELKRWKPIKKSWKAANNFNHFGYREFYMESLKQASQAIDAFDPAYRRFRSLFVAMNKIEFQDFLKDFEGFIQEQSAKRNVDTFEDRCLYQLNFNFFPNSKVPHA